MVKIEGSDLHAGSIPMNFVHRSPKAILMFATIYVLHETHFLFDLISLYCIFIFQNSCTTTYLYSLYNVKKKIIFMSIEILHLNLTVSFLTIINYLVGKWVRKSQFLTSNNRLI